MKVLTLATGLAVGYVLGTRAGREKYEEIAATFRKVTGQPGDTPAPDIKARAQEVVSELSAPTPAAVTPKPAAVTPKPAEVTPKPTAVTPKPAEVTPKPAEVTPKPAASTPKPTTVTTKPATVAPKPAPIPTAVPQPPRGKPGIAAPGVESTPLV